MSWRELPSTWRDIAFSHTLLEKVSRLNDWVLQNDKICLLLIYVDDILILADRAKIERLKGNFTKEFTWITMDVGKVHSYLGMHIEFGDGFVKVDMKHFIEKMLGEVNNLQEQIDELKNK